MRYVSLLLFYAIFFIITLFLLISQGCLAVESAAYGFVI
jgi:hypothetical protein